MRKIIGLGLALVLAVACGGSADCNLRDSTFALHAATAFTTTGCEAVPASFDVSATLARQPDGTYLLTGTENGVAFTASGRGTSTDCYAMPVWYDSANAHMYFLSLSGGPSRLDVVRLGKCMASYSLR